ncbi:hypothetical protein scyTo_0022059, partial [Scyliorhinus torazame]|nr:hypothetical protein [Scyliorhinus torazame]
ELTQYLNHLLSVSGHCLKLPVAWNSFGKTRLLRYCGTSYSTHSLETSPRYNFTID